MLHSFKKTPKKLPLHCNATYYHRPQFLQQPMFNCYNNHQGKQQWKPKTWDIAWCLLKYYSLSLELSTLAACGGTLTTRWVKSTAWSGNQTRAGRFRFKVDSSASSRCVFVSLSASWPSRTPIETRAFTKYWFRAIYRDIYYAKYYGKGGTVRQLCTQV